MAVIHYFITSASIFAFCITGLKRDCSRSKSWHFALQASHVASCFMHDGFGILFAASTRMSTAINCNLNFRTSPISSMILHAQFARVELGLSIHPIMSIGHRFSVLESQLLAAEQLLYSQSQMYSSYVARQLDFFRWTTHCSSQAIIACLCIVAQCWISNT